MRKGFTIIELIAEAIRMLQGFKTPVAEFSQRFPTVASGAIAGNLSKNTKYLDNITVSGGTTFWVVMIQFKGQNVNSKLLYKTIGFSTPRLGHDNATIIWNCFAATIQRSLLPQYCQRTAAY